MEVEYLLVNLYPVCLCCQLKSAQQEGLMLVDFKEGPLNFNPTYKFDKDTDVYDTRWGQGAAQS